MKGLGNLPSEVDPRREYFRSNSLGHRQIRRPKSPQICRQPVEAFAPRFEAPARSSCKARNARLGPLVRDDCSHAGATFRMVSAYAAAFGATGDEKFRKKAVDLAGQGARRLSATAPSCGYSRKKPRTPSATGRAFIYGLALQAALDVAAITSDEKWLDWSEDLATTAAEMFTAAEFLKECPDDAKIIDLPVTDLSMLFDDSTAGLISFAECRLADRRAPAGRRLSAQLATPLPTYLGGPADPPHRSAASHARPRNQGDRRSPARDLARD